MKRKKNNEEYKEIKNEKNDNNKGVGIALSSKKIDAFALKLFSSSSSSTEKKEEKKQDNDETNKFIEMLPSVTNIVYAISNYIASFEKTNINKISPLALQNQKKKVVSNQKKKQKLMQNSTTTTSTATKKADRFAFCLFGKSGVGKTTTVNYYLKKAGYCIKNFSTEEDFQKIYPGDRYILSQHRKEAIVIDGAEEFVDNCMQKIKQIGKNPSCPVFIITDEESKNIFSSFCSPVIKFTQPSNSDIKKILSFSFSIKLVDDSLLAKASGDVTNALIMHKNFDFERDSAKQLHATAQKWMSSNKKKENVEYVTEETSEVKYKQLHDLLLFPISNSEQSQHYGYNKQTFNVSVASLFDYSVMWDNLSSIDILDKRKWSVPIKIRRSYLVNAVRPWQIEIENKKNENLYQKKLFFDRQFCLLTHKLQLATAMDTLKTINSSPFAQLIIQGKLSLETANFIKMQRKFFIFSDNKQVIEATTNDAKWKQLFIFYEKMEKEIAKKRKISDEKGQKEIDAIMKL